MKRDMRFEIRKHSQSGFTMVELLLAMAFFSFILVFFSFGFIQVNRTFQKGVTIKRVTETGRLCYRRYCTQYSTL